MSFRTVVLGSPHPLRNFDQRKPLHLNSKSLAPPSTFYSPDSAFIPPDSVFIPPTGAILSPFNRYLNNIAFNCCLSDIAASIAVSVTSLLQCFNNIAFQSQLQCASMTCVSSDECDGGSLCESMLWVDECAVGGMKALQGRGNESAVGGMKG